MVRRYIEGPEDELIEYLGEVSARPGTANPVFSPIPRPTPGIAMGMRRHVDDPDATPTPPA